MKSKKRLYIIIGALAIVIIVIILVVNSIGKRNAQAAEFETVPLARGDLTAIVGATGSVHARQSSILTWQTSGQVGKVYVEIDDAVSANQILAELVPNSVSQNVILAEADLITARRALEDLKTSNLASASAYQAMVQAQKAVDDARETLESKQYARASQETIDVSRSNLIIAENAVTKAEEAYDRVDSLPEDSPIRAEAFSQLAKAKQNRDTALANLNWLLGLPDNQEMATANATLEVALARLEDSTQEWQRLKDGPDPDDIKAAEARVAALEATLKLKTLEAPFSGNITEIQTNPLDMINPGSIAFRIDDLSQLLIDVDIPEVDINRIKVGQPANISFDAIQTRQYQGEVVEVAMVGTVGQGVVNFQVTIALTNFDESVLPGMTAAVSIIVNQSQEVLLVPNRAVRLLNGDRVVYVLRDKTAVAVPITIGASSDTYSQLETGDIAEGELIILNPPTDLQRNFMFGP